MENEYAKVMSERSDAELIKIVTAERDKYNPTALEAAEAEVGNRNIDTSTFEKVKEKAVTERATKDKVDSGIVRSGTRFLNFIIDFFACLSLASTASVVIDLFIDTIGRPSLQLFSNIVFLGTIFAYYAIMEIKFQKTLGKFVTKTKVVTLNGEKPSNADIITRTFCRFIPFDCISFLFVRNGIHDFLSKTKVIKGE